VPYDHHLLTSHGNSIADALVQAHLNALVHNVRIAVSLARSTMSDSHTNKSRERRPFRNKTEALALAICCLSGALFPLRAAHAVPVDPGDYVAAPPGTNVLVQYVRYGRDDGINIEGAGDLTTHLDSEIGIFRAIHIASLFGLTGDPQIIIPLGSLKNVQIGGQPQNSSSGLGDPIVGASFWLINRPEAAISPLVTLPLGQYRRSNVLSIGPHRLSRKKSGHGCLLQQHPRRTAEYDLPSASVTISADDQKV
jgi:hypothetical protein